MPKIIFIRQFEGSMSTLLSPPPGHGAERSRGHHHADHPAESVIL